jgi:hypothetical protein
MNLKYETYSNPESRLAKEIPLDHMPTTKTTCFYETETVNEKFKLRFVRDVDFFIRDAFEFTGSKNSFSDITLILDIDLTLGEAILLPSLPAEGDTKVKMNGKDVDISLLERLHKLEKIEWFHGGYCCFFIRPYFHHFINFCINNFKEVIIWTNGVEKHAEDMSRLIKKITDKTLRYFWREHSIGVDLIKIVSVIGLDPSKTWMVDDDERHFFRSDFSLESCEIFDINAEVTFFHAPVFSVSYETFFTKVIHHWHDDKNMADFYDDWFLFLIWNWKFIKENKLDVKRFDKFENKFVYNS